LELSVEEDEIKSDIISALQPRLCPGGYSSFACSSVSLFRIIRCLCASVVSGKDLPIELDVLSVSDLFHFRLSAKAASADGFGLRER
jgi:hypothetical protein